MRAKFSDLTYDGGEQKSCCASKGCGQTEPWLTAEQIPVKGSYSAKDLEEMEHLNYAAGIAPFLRGPYSTMYVMRPWTIRQYAGFSTADASRLYLPIDPSPARPTVAAEERDPQSILNYVKGLIALRRQTPALGTQGAWRFVSDVEQPYPMVYARELDGQKYLVALNPSKRSATARFASEGAAAEAVYGTGDGAKYTSKNGLSTLKMKPVSAVILKITE